MPMIQIRYATPAGTDHTAAIAAEASRLSAEYLGKDPMVTAVLAEPADPTRWFCGGASLASSGKAAFWLDIRVTEGTNTKDEKAAFVAACFQSMARLLGPLHRESYAHVFEVRGDAYGFEGVTQERRYIQARM